MSFWDVPPAFHLYPACILPYPWYPVYPCIDYISIHFAADPLYPAVSHCIQLYPYVSSCIPLYLTVSHRLKNGTWPKIHSRGGLCLLPSECNRYQYRQHITVWNVGFVCTLYTGFKRPSSSSLFQTHNLSGRESPPPPGCSASPPGLGLLYKILPVPNLHGVWDIKRFVGGGSYIAQTACNIILQ